MWKQEAKEKKQARTSSGQAEPGKNTDKGRESRRAQVIKHYADETLWHENGAKMRERRKKEDNTMETSTTTAISLPTRVDGRTGLVRDQGIAEADLHQTLGRLEDLGSGLGKAGPGPVPGEGQFVLGPVVGRDRDRAGGVLLQGRVDGSVLLRARGGKGTASRVRRGLEARGDDGGG